MNLLAFLLIVAGSAAFVLAVFVVGTAFLDGWDARRDAARRNQAHRHDAIVRAFFDRDDR